MGLKSEGGAEICQPSALTSTSKSSSRMVIYAQGD